MFPTGESAMLSVKHYFSNRLKREASIELLYRPDTAPTKAQLDTFAQMIYTAFSPLWAAVAASEWTYDALKARYLAWNEADTEFVSWYYGNVTGDLGAEDADDELGALPTEIACLIRKETNKPGRANRGRLYLPGIAEEATQDDFTHPDLDAAFAAIANELEKVQTLGTGTAAPRLWNLKDNKLVVITKCTVMRKLSRRKDRLERRGVIGAIP